LWSMFVQQEKQIFLFSGVKLLHSVQLYSFSIFLILKFFSKRPVLLVWHCANSRVAFNRHAQGHRGHLYGFVINSPPIIRFAFSDMECGFRQFAYLLSKRGDDWIWLREFRASLGCFNNDVVSELRRCVLYFQVDHLSSPNYKRCISLPIV